MTYATRTDLEQIGGADEIAQRESVLPVGAVDDALAKADAMIDGYLLGRYGVPLVKVPDMLPPLAVAIARYNLLGETATERARNDYKDAISRLLDIQAGRMRLPGAAPLPGSEPSMVVMAASEPGVFGRRGRP